MNREALVALRNSLGLSQGEFGQLFGVHAMTVSKWERGILVPTPYHVALMEQFRKTAAAREAQAKEEVKKLLVGAGVVAALAWLLTRR